MTNVCNMILYKRTPYKKEQTSNWSVSMTCLSLVRKGRKVSKSKHQLIINRIFKDVFPTAPCIISFWNRKAESMAARPSFLLGFINSAWGVAWWYSHVPPPGMQLHKVPNSAKSVNWVQGRWSGRAHRSLGNCTVCETSVWDELIVLFASVCYRNCELVWLSSPSWSWDSRP